MFPARYFAPTYFPAGYFAESGSGGSPPADVTGTGGVAAGAATAVGLGTVLVSGSGVVTAGVALTAGAAGVKVVGQGQSAGLPAAVAGVGLTTFPTINSSGSCVGSIASATGLGSATGSYSKTIRSESPAGYWRLGEASGTAGIDASPNARGGTYAGTYTLGAAAGLVGDTDTATAFNNGYLQVAHNVAFNPDSSVCTVLTFRVKTTATSGTLLSKRSGNAGYAVRVNANGKLGVFFGDSAGAWADSPGSAVVNDNAWHTVLVALYTVTGLWFSDQYVDGVLQDSVTGSGNTPASGGNLFIGSDGTSGPAASLDEVAVWSGVDQIPSGRPLFIHDQATYSPVLPTPAWSSRPRSPNKIYLCMDGRPAEAGYAATVGWGTIPRRQLLFNRVAAAWAPWDVDVTTIDPCKYGNAPAVGRVVIAAQSGPTAGGVSDAVGDYYGSPDSGVGNTSYVFPNNLSDLDWAIASATAHESGHGWGLKHQSTYSGVTKTNEYNPGNGSAAPTMGVAYSSARSLWWKGQSSSSVVIQDDLAVLSANLPAPFAALGLIRSVTDTCVHNVAGPAVVTVVGDDMMLRPSITVKNAAGTTTATSNTGAQTQTVSVPAGNCTVTVASNGLLADGSGWGGYDVGTYTLTSVPISTGSGSVVGSQVAAGVGVGTVTNSTAAGSGSSAGQVATASGASAVLVTGAATAQGQTATSAGVAVTTPLATGSGSAGGQTATGVGVSSIRVMGSGAALGYTAIGTSVGVSVVTGSGTVIGGQASGSGSGSLVVTALGSSTGQTAVGVGSGTVVTLGSVTGSGVFLGYKARGFGSGTVSGVGTLSILISGPNGAVNSGDIEDLGMVEKNSLIFRPYTISNVTAQSIVISSVNYTSEEVVDIRPPVTVIASGSTGFRVQVPTDSLGNFQGSVIVTAGGDVVSWFIKGQVKYYITPSRPSTSPNVIIRGGLHQTFTSQPASVSGSGWIEVLTLPLKEAYFVLINIVNSGAALTNLKVTKASKVGGTHTDWVVDTFTTLPPGFTSSTSNIATLSNGSTGTLQLGSTPAVDIREIKIFAKSAGTTSVTCNGRIDSHLRDSD